MTDPRDQQDEDNQEQRESDQAQDVADDAMEPENGADALDSAKPDGGITDDDSDVHDTLDMMKQMISSGRVDMGAFAGEPLMDDGDEAMPGTPAGPMMGREDDVMGTSPDEIDEVADTGADPLDTVISDDDEYDSDEQTEADRPDPA